jgi:hypothetical protein
VSADEISYPIDRMQQTAQRIKANAQQAYERHVVAWRSVEALIARFPGFMQAPLRAVFDPHDQRFRLSYQWQMDFADHLVQAANSMQQVDENGAQQFK